MKKLLLITGAILIAYVILTAVMTPAVATPAAVSAEKTESGYLIAESEGRIAVYRDGGLVLRTDTKLSDLPKSDAARLREGIEVNSMKELKRLLEDYCS